jgi:hypothetical protein
MMLAQVQDRIGTPHLRIKREILCEPGFPFDSEARKST